MIRGVTRRRQRVRIRQQHLSLSPQKYPLYRSLYRPPPCLTSSRSSSTFLSSSSVKATRCVSFSDAKANPSSTTLLSSSPGVPSRPTKVRAGQAPCSQCSPVVAHTLSIHSDLQGCRYRFRSHGLHRLLRQAHSHPHVRLPFLSCHASHSFFDVVTTS